MPPVPGEVAKLITFNEFNESPWHWTKGVLWLDTYKNFFISSNVHWYFQLLLFASLFSQRYECEFLALISLPLLYSKLDI